MYLSDTFIQATYNRNIIGGQFLTGPTVLIKVSMKQKKQWSFLPYCGVYLSEVEEMQGGV